MSGLPVLLFLDVSGGELMVIMLVVFLVLGPEKMPDLARKAGRLMNQLKKATNDLTNEFKKETSVLSNEINDAHKKVDEQIESVRREVNRTKAQVIKDMDTEIKPVTASDSEKPTDKNIISDIEANSDKTDFSTAKKE
jgi:Tat protein translocase TatB subunit